MIDFFVVGIELGFEEKDGGDAPRHFLDVFDFLDGQGPAEEEQFAIGKPLFDDLIAADGVVPGAGRNVGPAGGAVEIDVAGFFAEAAKNCFSESLKGFRSIEKCLPLVGRVRSGEEFAFAGHSVEAGRVLQIV